MSWLVAPAPADFFYETDLMLPGISPLSLTDLAFLRLDKGTTKLGLHKYMYFSKMLSCLLLSAAASSFWHVPQCGGGHQVALVWHLVTRYLIPDTTI